MMSMISVRGARKTYRLGFRMQKSEALKGVDLDVREGELHGFVGPNGAGKSTTIKLALGLLRPTAGTIRLMERTPSDPESRREVGYLPEQPYFYDYLSGREILEFYGRLSGLQGRELGQRIEEAASRTGVREEWIGRKLRTYSKGMLQRVGLAQAILHRPRLLILDEPMSGLDPVGRRDVRLLLRDLHAEGVTIFYSSHVLSDVEAICSRVSMIVGGEMRRQGTVDEVLGDAEKAFLIRLRLNGSAQAPAGEPVSGEAGRYLCRTEEENRLLLAWALEQGIDVISVESARPTLEEALAKEIARQV